MNEELDSQLSAMFDNELAAGECELMARRLSRDEQLKARWGRYAVIGATIRTEGGARLHARIASRVSLAISAEPAVASGISQPYASNFATRWWRPAAGVAVAAGVAAVSILWVRVHSGPADQLLAQQTVPSQRTVAGGIAPPSGGAVSYVVPKAVARRSIVPATQLANYVVAHSEFSSPVNRRNLLSALMANEPTTSGQSSGSEEPADDVYDDSKTAQ